MALLQGTRLSATARLLACAALLCAACSSSSPSRAELGTLTIENGTELPLVFRAVWTEESEGVHVLVEGLLPPAGGDTLLVQQAGLAAGVELRFAVEGAGWEDTLERNGQEMEAMLPVAGAREGWGSAAFLSRTSGTEPRAVGPLEPAQARWTATGEAAGLVLRSTGDGGIRVDARP